MAEFAYNNTISTTTGITPFFALYGQHPRYVINPVQNPDQTPNQTLIPTALKEWAYQLGKLNLYLKSEMTYAQALQA